jgi:hypothetical protein
VYKLLFGNIAIDTNMNKDLYKGILIFAGVLLALIVAGFAMSDNGMQKASCIGRALGAGIAVSNIGQVCGL